jgi:hypothetical protein
MVAFKILLTEGIFQRPRGCSDTTEDALLTMGKFKIFSNGSLLDSGFLEGFSFSG